MTTEQKRFVTLILLLLASIALLMLAKHQFSAPINV